MLFEYTLIVLIDQNMTMGKPSIHSQIASDTLFLHPIQSGHSLRKEIHSLIGSLCYSKAPRLNQATLDFQTAARDMSDATIEQTYARVKEEAEGFMVYWDKHQLSAGA